MVKLLLFLTLGLLSSHAIAQQQSQAALHSVHYQPGQGWDSWSLQLGYMINDFVLDEDSFDSKYFHINMGWMYGLRPDIMWFGSISHVDFGDRSRTYADDTNLAAMKESFKGLEYVELGLQKRYPQFLDQGIDQSFQLKIKTQPFRAKDTNASLGGTNISAHYHYSFLHSWGEVLGSIDGIYYGTKKLNRIDGETQQTKHHGELGLNLGAKRVWTKFYMGLLSGFGVRTDYDVSSLSYNRSADNGFHYQGKILLGWDNQNYLAELALMRRTELSRSKNKNFEFTSDHITLKFLWPF